MLYNYFTEELLNLQGVLIKNIEKIENTRYVYLEMPVIEHSSAYPLGSISRDIAPSGNL